MPVSKKCSFCGEPITPGRGLMYVKRDGTIFYFCSKKCEKNMKMGRKPHEVKWTRKYREKKEKT